MSHAENADAAIADPTAQSNSNGTRGIVVKLKKELLAKDPDLASITTVTDTNIKTIQACLGSDEAILEYYSTERDWFVFVLKRNSIRVAAINGAGLEKDVLDFREKLTRVGSENYASKARALYQRLFAPVAGQLTKPKLIIVPHGMLHYLPFGALSQERIF